MSEKPIEQINVGNGIRAEAWRNETKDGQEYFSVKISRSYKADDDKWHETNVFSRDHLPKLALASNMMFERLIERQYGMNHDEQKTEGFAGKETAKRAKKKAARKVETEKD